MLEFAPLTDTGEAVGVNVPFDPIEAPPKVIPVFVPRVPFRLMTLALEKGLVVLMFTVAACVPLLIMTRWRCPSGPTTLCAVTFSDEDGDGVIVGITILPPPMVAK